MKLLIRITFVVMLFSLVVTVKGAYAQSNEELYGKGYWGYSQGNCVIASRYWYAYLLRSPAIPDSDPNRIATLKTIIQKCDQNPARFAKTIAHFMLKRPSKDVTCEQYAEMAIAQNNASELFQCDFSGPRWSNNHNHHYRWCMDVDPGKPNIEFTNRADALKECAPDGNSRGKR